MKKYLSRFLVITLFGTGILSSCQKGAVPWSEFNPLNSKYFIYAAFPTNFLDVSDGGLVDLYTTYFPFQPPHNLDIEFVSSGALDPNAGGDAYWMSQTYAGDYSYHKKIVGMSYSNMDTLHITNNRKWPLDIFNGSWTCVRGGAPSWETRKSFTLTNTATGVSFIIIKYEQVGTFRLADGTFVSGMTYYKGVNEPKNVMVDANGKVIEFDASGVPIENPLHEKYTPVEMTLPTTDVSLSSPSN